MILAIAFKFKVFKCLELVETSDSKYQVLAKVWFHTQFWKKKVFTLCSPRKSTESKPFSDLQMKLQNYIAFLPALFFVLP